MKNWVFPLVMHGSLAALLVAGFAFGHDVARNLALFIGWALAVLFVLGALFYGAWTGPSPASSRPRRVYMTVAYVALALAFAGAGHFFLAGLLLFGFLALRGRVEESVGVRG